MPLDPFQTLVKAISDHYDADIYAYIGGIDRPFDDSFIARVKSFKRRKNVLLLLTTLGGDPNAAYRIARCLQSEYKTVSSGQGQGTQKVAGGIFYLFVASRCKSAGTILATGANTLIMNDYAELGPIDVQLRKGDEVGERSSSLTPMHAIESLRDLSIKHFEDCFKELRFNEELVFGTKAASEIATKMSTSLFGRIFAQIDPMRVAEFDRAMRIASEYGERLGRDNLQEGGLKRLVVAYPTHGFVIDRTESQEIFKSVLEPTTELDTLGNISRANWESRHLTANSPWFVSLTTPDLFQDDTEATVVEPPANGETDSPNGASNPASDGSGNAEEPKLTEHKPNGSHA
jgi:hypothetical protein